MFPEIPVGGRLKFFREIWNQITQDEWVLSVIKEGYKLEFLQKPMFMGVKKTSIATAQIDVLLKEVEELLSKNAIEIVPQQEKLSGFYSTFFLVPKKCGKMRPIINLRPLNRYLKKQHFKMDTLNKVLNVVKPMDWAISIDLTDAYLHIPIFLKHRKFLRFCVQNQCYQWKTLCFGPTSAPRVFTKIVSVVAAYLRTRNIRLVVYLDDWLVVNQCKENLIQDREICLNLLVSLGFIINKKKSCLDPCQSIVYLGALFLFKQKIVLPSQDRLINLVHTTKMLMKGQKTARDLLQWLGIVSSCIDLIPNARLYMRPVQLHLLSFWKPSSLDLEKVIPITQHLKLHLQWWLNTANISRGKSLQLEEIGMTITTDASLTGYGGHLNNQIVQGSWDSCHQKWHINCLEMEAVFLTLKHFQRQIQNKTVLIRCDNTTVVQYINKQGGTKSPRLCYQTWDLWNWAISQNIKLKAAHIAGKLNVLADHLSRVKIRQTEWMLNKEIVQTIFQMWGHPLIDMFASVHNRQTQIFCTWYPHNQAYALDALTIPWEGMFLYAYPPMCLIPKVLQHIRQYNCQVILIAPFWPRRPWYTELLQLLIAVPLKLPNCPQLLQQPNTKIFHPNVEVLQLTAWLLSTEASKKRVFLKTLEPYLQQVGDQAPKKIILANSNNLIAGVVQGKLIPIQHL